MRHSYKLHWSPDAVAYNLDQFRNWIFSSSRGEKCLYHIGQIAIDQENSPPLRNMGDYASLMSDFRVVAISQRRVGDGMFQYFAARTSHSIRAVPESLATGILSVKTYISLRAVSDRQGMVSTKRAIMDATGTNREEATLILQEMIKMNLIENNNPSQITSAGKAALA